MGFIDVFEKTINQKIKRYENLANTAYEMGWFKEQEQYLTAVEALTELKEELV